MTTTNPTQITPPRVELLDPRTGLIDRAWYRWLQSIYTNQLDITGAADIAPSQAVTQPSTMAMQEISYGPANGDFLIYDQASVQWVCSDATAVGAALGLGSMAYEDLSGTPVDGDFLVYSSGAWASSDAGAVQTALFGSATLNYFLVGDGTVFTPLSPSAARSAMGLGTIATENTGASGSFTTADAKTVTVTNGIIVSIV